MWKSFVIELEQLSAQQKPRATASHKVNRMKRVS